MDDGMGVGGIEEGGREEGTKGEKELYRLD